MPYLQPKRKSGTAWLPTQVAYGMDCSDPEPANWTPFGYLVDAQQAKHVKPAPEFEIKKRE